MIEKKLDQIITILQAILHLQNEIYKRLGKGYKDDLPF